MHLILALAALIVAPPQAAPPQAVPPGAPRLSVGLSFIDPGGKSWD